MSTKEQVLDIVSEYVDVPAEEISLDEPLKLSGEINSFVFLSMISAIEERFGVTISNSRMAEFKTLAQIISFLENPVSE